ncbi:tetratricopeptide repeat protein [Neolewinella persica]|uniref:tetratricopeptide repeat protein n=1 Tax=Neolewinella persica TaxID=70998 RepID=UPI0003A51167|nr:tetratricopeptide repeat protein [Neolewinella persica]
MSKVLSIGLVAVITLFSIFAMTSYRQANKGALLFGKYFEAAPMEGYGTQRSLASGQRDTDASILRQGIAYHQQEDFDLALVSFRAYLEGNPEPDNGQVFLLAATAAMASGNYAEGEEYLEQIAKDDPQYGAAASWHTALLELRKEHLEVAAAEFRLLEQSGMDRLYPVKAILENF